MTGVVTSSVSKDNKIITFNYRSDETSIRMLIK